ncbi:MAG: helix-hairpin-helix domain-containing protein [Prevotella sp.]|nr:helix-hairpin-helix domain-containing protein [Prevotella sp.]
MNWSSALSLRKSDRRVLLVLLVLLVAIFAALFFFDDPQPQNASMPAPTDSVAAQTTDTLGGRSPLYYQTQTAAPERFPFDPNTADSTQLLRLGLQPWQVRNIYKYRAAGGIYRKKEDFARLYGLTVKQYRELEPYIHISADYLPAATLVENKQQPEQQEPEPDTLRPALRYPGKIAPGETVDLNAGDTTVYRTVPGIGSYFARRIADYRTRLGGYVSVDQLDEIEDFPQESKQYFTVSDAHPQKLLVNRLSLNQLKRHPYINFYQAKAIVDHRRLDGPLHSLSELKMLRDFPPEAISRLEPYVDYTE